jgi:hypothetical protein
MAKGNAFKGPKTRVLDALPGLFKQAKKKLFNKEEINMLANTKVPAASPKAIEGALMDLFKGNKLKISKDQSGRRLFCYTGE